MFVLKKLNNNSSNNDDSAGVRKGLLLFSFFASLRIIYFWTNSKNKAITN